MFGVLCFFFSFVSCINIMSILCCFAVCVSSVACLCRPFMLNCSMFSDLFRGVCGECEWCVSGV